MKPVDMQPVVLTAVSLALAWGTARFATPHMIATAKKLGIVDRPDGRLKSQEEPVPYLGGLAVALGVIIAVGAVSRFEQSVLAVLLGAFLVLLLGLVDDLGSLSPHTKLAGQLLAVLVVTRAGVKMEVVFLSWWVTIPLTVLWMLAATNAFNLIDVMDGLSSGVGAVAALFLAGIALATGLDSFAYLGAALCGALVGFRHFNVQPAKIYMGDTGSLFCGFLLGALAFVNPYTGNHRLGLVAPLLILGVPLFDMLFVMWVRHRRGMPVMLGSPDHVALRLRKWKLSTHATVRANVVASGVLGGSGVAIMLLPITWGIGLLAVLAVAALVLAVWLRTIDMHL